MRSIILSLTLLGCASALPAPQSLDQTTFWSQISQLSYGGVQLAPAWSAHAEVGYSSDGLGKKIGTYWRDTFKSAWRIKACALQTLFHPTDHTCTDELSKNSSGYDNLNMTVGVGDDSVCKAFPTSYYDLFAALKYATRTGSARVGGVSCSVWALETPTYNVSACVASDGVPRQFNLSTGLAYKAASAQFYTFSNVTVGQPSDSVFAPSDACANKYPMPPCPNLAVQPLDLYRVRSSGEPNVLANRNLGDALGDMAFFCDLAGVDPSQVVTHWSVQANSSWGQYGYCLYQGGKNICYGSTGNRVGRESALGIEGAVQGQCSPNHQVGSWYSIPAEGECAEGAAVGSDGCTWSAHSVRSVSAACILNERGLKASCAAERGHAPMLKSAAIFKAALASSDPARGGCKDIEEVLVVPL